MLAVLAMAGLFGCAVHCIHENEDFLLGCTVACMGAVLLLTALMNI